LTAVCKQPEVFEFILADVCNLKKCVGQTSLVNYEVFRDSTQLIMLPHHWPWISYIAWSSLWSCWPL